MRSMINLKVVKYMTNDNNEKNNLNKVIKKFPSDAFVMKALTLFGIIFLFIGLLYLMNYFFIEKNHLKINTSTDKKQEYVLFNGEEELMTTQKYVSDLEYSMRYDINNFSVFKYKEQDIYKFLEAEKILVVVEKATVPSNCTKTNLDSDYTNCMISPDDFTDEYFITSGGKSFKITVKTPNTADDEENIYKRIDYMLSSFQVTNK